MERKQKIVVVGGGFAGVQFARNLDEKLFDILLIDKLNHHQFQPLFYQVATSLIEPSSISFPLRHIFRKKKNLSIRLAEVQSVNSAENKVITDIGVFDYDHLVLAMGCSTNFFGNENIAKHALTLKTSYDAIHIRNHILQNFENIISASLHEKKVFGNIVIVGAGPTGVELAGSFAEIKNNILPKDYKKVDFSSDLRIILVEGSSHTLNSMSDVAKNASEKYLNRVGVEVFKDTFVKDYDGDLLTFNNREPIRTKTVIWAAGVTANIIEGLPKESFVHGNRLKVDRYNKVENIENIYALGDMAFMDTPKYPKGHPQLANVAINQAKRLAKNLKKMRKNEALTEYEYKDLGSMATLGRNNAVVDLPFMKFKGFFAWLIWMFLHLMLILSVRNKLIIFINWVWAYVSKNTSLRLILREHTHTE